METELPSTLTGAVELRVTLKQRNALVPLAIAGVVTPVVSDWYPVAAGQASGDAAVVALTLRYPASVPLPTLLSVGAVAVTLMSKTPPASLALLIFTEV